jgi:hypothetical protein
MPRTLWRRCVLPQDVEIAVVRADFEEGIMRAIPVVEYLINQVFVPAKSKPNRPFFRFSAGIAINLKLQILSLAHRNTPDT